MTKCIYCNNTARHGEAFCGRCDAQVSADRERDRLFEEMDSAIMDLAYDEPVQRACEAIRDVLRDIAGRR